MKARVLITLCLALGLVFSVSAAAQAKLQLKLAHFHPAAGVYNYQAEVFKKLIEERSKGEIEIVIYTDGVLGDERSLPEALQFGTIDLAVNTLAAFANYSADFGGLDLPYLFKDWDHIYRFLKSPLHTEFVNVAQNRGIIGLGLFCRGYRFVTSGKAPVTSFDQMKGFKLRTTQSPIYVKVFEFWKANVSAMSFADAFTALQQGALDGLEINLQALVDHPVYEVQKYVANTRHIACWAGLWASGPKWNAWSPEVRKLIQDCAMESAMITTEFCKKQEEEVLVKFLEGKGMKFNDIDTKPFQDAAVPVYDWYKKTYGDKSFNWIEKFRAL